VLEEINVKYPISNAVNSTEEAIKYAEKINIL